MRALVQRVKKAQVSIEGVEVGAIGQGYLIFLGVGREDGKPEAEKLWQKIEKLRIFEDENGKTNLNLASVGGEVLIVSQFTLWASLKGNRPGFTESAPPQQAEALYDYFVSLARQSLGEVPTGRFGADMEVRLINNGPFTLWLDTASF